MNGMTEKRGTDAKIVEAVVLLERQYLLTCHLIKAGSSALVAMEQAISAKKQGLEHVLSVFNYVFALIDGLVRYQKLVFSLPMISQNRPECRALNAAMGDLKEVRNQLQHINNDIENEQSGPLLGAVCWVNDSAQFLASFHDVSRRRSSPGIVLDTQTGKYLHEFCYVYNDIYYDLGRAIAGMHRFQGFLKESVQLTVNGKPYDPAEHYVAARIDMKFKGDK